jgi:hypothetical protein
VVNFCLGYDSVRSSTSAAVFQGNLLPPPSIQTYDPFTLMMQVEGFIETLEYICHTTQFHLPKDRWIV